MRRLYTLLLYVLSPLFLARLWWRGRRNPGYRERTRERFGCLPENVPSGCILIHAVSVGESQATQPLVRWLLEHHPELPLVMTTTTPTGAERVRQLYGDKVRHLYFPYDLPSVIERYMEQLQPKMILIMETEIWPNLAHICHLKGLPLMLVNARLSESSAQGYVRIQRLIGSAIGSFDAIIAQTEDDARRFRRLGAPDEIVHTCGSIKFDVNIPASVLEQGELMRAALGSDRPVWIAASTHEGEESEVIRIHQQLLEKFPAVLLILVPRHPERFDRVATLVADAGLKYRRRSESRSCEADNQVYLGDVMGELPVFYSASDVAFVAGSLVPIGGHNILEPGALSVPVVVGPHMHNFSAITEMMLEAGATLQVNSSEELGEKVADLLADPIRRNQMGQAALSVVVANQGALDCIAEHIEAGLRSARS